MADATLFADMKQIRRQYLVEQRSQDTVLTCHCGFSFCHVGVDGIVTIRSNRQIRQQQVIEEVELDIWCTRCGRLHRLKVVEGARIVLGKMNQGFDEILENSKETE